MSQSDKQYAVVGLGRFGMSICEELSAQGAEVLAIDINEELVQKASDVATQAIVADCINEETLSELHLQDYDLVVVAIGEKVKNSIMATLLLKESGVKKVWVKANDRFHARILQKVGADKVILPERDMGVRIARSIMDIRVFDFLELGSEQAITEFVIGNKNMGHKLQELPIFNIPGIQLLALKKGPEIMPCPDKELDLGIGDILILAGNKDQLNATLKQL